MVRKTVYWWLGKPYESRRERKCRLGKHRMGMWFGDEFIEGFDFIGDPDLRCKYCDHTETKPLSPFEQYSKALTTSATGRRPQSKRDNAKQTLDRIRELQRKLDK